MQGSTGERNLGALWEKQGKKGRYMSGYVEIDGVKHEIVVFPNGYKDAENKPDWKIYPKRNPTDAALPPQ